MEWPISPDLFNDLFRWPRNCVVCGCAANGALCLCSICCEQLPWAGVSCYRCALPLFTSDPAPLCCGACAKNPPPLDHCAAVFRYETPIQQLISAFKFHGGLSEGRVLGHLLAASMASHYTGCREHCLLLPVPLHSKRLRQRGFNQAAFLARIVSRSLRMPMSLTLVRRNLNTPSQALLDARQRRQNLRAAFETTGNIPQGKLERIIVIDDVMTTLSTVSALASTLRDAGEEQIDAWALARAYKVPI